MSSSYSSSWSASSRSWTLWQRPISTCLATWAVLQLGLQLQFYFWGALASTTKSSKLFSPHLAFIRSSNYIDQWSDCIQTKLQRSIDPAKFFKVFGFNFFSFQAITLLILNRLSKWRWPSRLFLIILIPATTVVMFLKPLSACENGACDGVC